jgi:hypothetical protein
MKFGKHIQKRQLEVPEYAASFVNYKALKKGEEIAPVGIVTDTAPVAHQEALGHPYPSAPK